MLRPLYRIQGLLAVGFLMQGVKDVGVV